MFVGKSYLTCVDIEEGSSVSAIYYSSRRAEEEGGQLINTWTRSQQQNATGRTEYILKCSTGILRPTRGEIGEATN